MSFLVPANRMPIPEYQPTAAKIAMMFGGITMQEVPGAIIRGGSSEGARFALRSLTELVRARGGTVTDPMKGIAILGEEEIGWHIDRRPDASLLTVHLHHTVEGCVKAELAVPRPGLWMPERVIDFSTLPDGLQRQLDGGMVDDDLFEPTIYTTDPPRLTAAGSSEVRGLGVDDLLVFTVGGLKPTAHRFTNLEGPRRSALYVATLPAGQA